MILDLEKIRQIVKNLPLDFEEQMQWSIKRNGVSEYTLIYAYKGSQFVFIEVSLYSHAKAVERM